MAALIAFSRLAICSHIRTAVWITISAPFYSCVTITTIKAGEELLYLRTLSISNKDYILTSRALLSVLGSYRASSSEASVGVQSYISNFKRIASSA